MKTIKEQNKEVDSALLTIEDWDEPVDGDGLPASWFEDCEDTF